MTFLVRKRLGEVPVQTVNTPRGGVIVSTPEATALDLMKAARIHRFGPPDVILVEEMPRPRPAAGEILVRIVAAGVGPWDALIREGKSKVSPPPPLTLGSDVSGVVEAIGADVTQFKIGDEVYGVTNPQFVGANAEFANASAGMLALKPERLTHLEAA